jgi:hypothetical protein
VDHLERQNQGFVTRALNSLKSFTPGPQAKSVGAHLYNVLVSEGRLVEFYPEFVRSVMVAAIPEPGLWTQARILESTAETRVFTHPSARIGDTEHNSQRLTQDRQRFADHRFTVAVPPFTARFFAVAADLRESRTIDVRLADQRGGDADEAWLYTLPPVGRADLKAEMQRLPASGASLPGLGREYATLWIGVFNATPGGEHRFDLTLTLRRDAAKATPGRPVRTGA